MRTHLRRACHIKSVARQKFELGADGNDCHEAAGFRAFFAVGEQEIAAAGGAEIADENIFFAQADVQELGAVGFFQVEENILGRRLVAGGHHVEPLNGIGLVAGAIGVQVYRSKERAKLGT